MFMAGARPAPIVSGSSPPRHELSSRRVVVLLEGGDFVLPVVALARWDVELTQRDGQREADRSGREMSLPGHAGLDRQHAPHRSTVKKSDEQGGRNGAAIAPDHA